MKPNQYRRLTFFLLLIVVLAECLPGKPNAGMATSHWWGEEALAAPLEAAAAQTFAADKSIAIDAAGFTPAQLTITMGEQVEWHNTTAQEQTVHSGRPPGVANHPLFLPLVLGSVQSAAATVAMAAAPVVDDDNFEITIPPDGHVAHTFTAMGEHPYYLVSNPGQTGAIVVEAHNPPLAPPNAGAVPLSLFDSAQFLFSGDHPRQTGVAAGAIDPQRIVVLRGAVLDHAEAPAASVVVHVVDHPEFGQTLTQKDGSFDLAVNGGGATTLAYEKVGFLPIQRTMSLPWQEYVNLDAVVLSALDTQVTTIDLSHTGDFQIARGTRQNDNDGSRQATLLVGNETQASMTLPNGKSKPLSTLKIRATEYTVGTLGMASMPGSLPPSSGYTYAVELTVDEALAAGATSVQFSKPLINYTENFIGAPVGSPVPAGYYDRQQGRWIPSKNGIVIKLVAESNAKAQIDINGDGVADSGDALNALGITDAELAQLASLYEPGQELWRVEISHFSPWDFNWPFGLPAGAQAPRLREFVWQDPNDPCRQAGSIIGCETQTLGENLPVAGAPFNLVYQSDRVPGWKVGDTLRIPITGPTIPPHLKGIQLEIDIAGERHEWRWCSDEISAIPSCEQKPKIAPNLNQNFLWDGLDAYNRKLYGRATAHARVLYIYDITYYTAREEFDKSFAQFPDNVEIFDGRLCGDPFFCGIPVAQHLYRSIGAWDASASDGLGGWTVDIHHTYDPLEHVLHLGNGTTVDSNSIGATAMTIAGGGVEDPPVTGGIAAQTASLDYLVDIAEAPDGTIYTYSNGDRNHIFKIDPKGIVTTIAGKSYEKGEPSGDGGPALQATLGAQVLGLAVGPDGSLYFSVMGKNYPAGYIRKIDRQGIITTIAGVNDTSAVGGNGDGGPALQAKVTAPIDLVFGPDGCLYFGEGGAAANGYHPRIRKIQVDGTITTVAGGGAIAMDDLQPDNGILATTVNLAPPYGLAFGPDGSLYIAHSEAHIVTRVTTDGMITRFAGNGNVYVGYDGELATSLAIGSPVNVAVDREGAVYIRSNTILPPVRIMRVGGDGILKFVAGGLGDCIGGSKDGLSGRQTCIGGQSRGLELSPDGSLIFSDGRYRVRRLSLPFTGFGPLSYAIPSQDGSVIYEFDANGRHLRTSSALTGALLYHFVYDAAGRLSQIVDANNNVTHIERTESGWPTAIVAPGGQRTTLEIGGDGYLSAVGNPGGGTSHMTYGEEGLLASFADPSGALSSFTYSDEGRLTRDQEPLGDYKSLARVETATAATVTVTSKLGHATVYAMQILPNGDRMRTVTDAGGATTTLLSRADGTHTTIGPDGTRTDMTLAADPRWGMAAAYATSISSTLPSGLQGLVTVQRKVELNDATNPLSLKTLSEEVIVNGKRTVGTYRAAEHTITTRSSGGRQTVVTIDDEGRTLSEQAANQAPTRFTYDEKGRLTATAQGSGDSERRYSLAYNAATQLESITDPLGQISRYSYNDAGLAAMQTLGDGTQIGYGYNDNGAVTSLTPAGRPTHTLAYTANGQLSGYTAPDAGGGAAPAVYTYAYTYNDDGLPLRTTRPDGQKVDFGYDGSGRLAAMNTPQGAYTYSYDGAGNPQVIKSPGNVMLTYHYDGPLLTGESWVGPVHGDVAYSYDQNLRATASRVNGTEVAYAYDNDSLLTSAGAMTLIHDGHSGQLSATTLGSVSDQWLYNEFAEATQYQARAANNALYNVDTTYDKVGRILTKTEKIGGVSTTYGYHYDESDRLDQLTRDGAVAASYSYDANGNRLTGPGLDTPATYDAQDRLLRYMDAEFTYTANGEVASKKAGNQTTSYQYDVQGNLLAAALPEGKQISYVVDGLSRRIGKRVNGTLVQGFLYQGQYSPVAETDGSGNVVSLFVYATRSNVPDYLIKAGVTYRILSDQLGSPRLVVNTQTGATVQRIDYDVWGNITADSNPGFQPFGFAGGLYDGDTQLTHFGAQEYDAITGRWRQKDPLGFEGGDTNLYAYAENNPVNLIDPTGTFIIIPVIIAAWAVVEVGLSIADAISTASTLMNPCATSGEKALAVGLFVVGLLAPGGGYSTAAKQIGREVRVIGHFGEYLEMAAKIPGSKTFHIPPKIAELMTEAEIWSANRRFLDAGIRKAQEFLLATPLNRVKLGSGLAKEIDYLLEHGYKFAKNGLSLIPF